MERNFKLQQIKIPSVLQSDGEQFPQFQSVSPTAETFRPTSQLKLSNNMSSVPFYPRYPNHRDCDGSCFCGCDNPDHDCHKDIPWYRVRMIAWLDSNGKRYRVERMCVSCNAQWIRRTVVNQDKRMKERNIYPDDVVETWKRVSCPPWDPENLWFRFGRIP